MAVAAAEGSNGRKAAKRRSSKQTARPAAAAGGRGEVEEREEGGRRRLSNREAHDTPRIEPSRSIRMLASAPLLLLCLLLVKRQSRLLTRLRTRPPPVRFAHRAVRPPSFLRDLLRPALPGFPSLPSPPLPCCLSACCGGLVQGPQHTTRQRTLAKCPDRSRGRQTAAGAEQSRGHRGGTHVEEGGG
jgi:hypothetical protein